jgi:hypothetical protein
MIWLQCKSDDDDIMHPKSLSVKENVAASAQNLATSAFLFHNREQMSTQVVLSTETQAYWIVHPTLRKCCTTTHNWPVSTCTLGR